MTRGRKNPPPDAAGSAFLALLLLIFFVGLFVVRGFSFPIGPDGTVYLWWARLAGAEGLSAVNRPGVPAVALTLSGALHLPLTGIMAALQCALGTSLGLGAAMLLRSMSDPAPRAGQGVRATWLLGGALAGVFAVHLVSGYLANLALATTFVAAAVALAAATRRGVAAAALLLAAGGLSHPEFFLVAVLILAITAGLALLRRDPSARREAARVGIAVAGGAAVVGVGFLALLAGPRPPQVDTSRDAFLRRVGRLATLQHLYRQRFVQHSARYVEWVSLPLAVAGVSKLRGFVGRFLASWAIVTVLGVGLGLATARFPPDRFVTFGYVVPLLAAIGAVRLWRSLRRKRAVATALVVVVLLAMMLGTFFAWRREKPYINLSETASVTTASRWIESTSEGTPLYFVVESGDSSITFFATQAANTIRAAVPPDRIRDVHVLVPPGNARPGSERDVLSRSTYAAEAHDLFTPSRWMLEFELRPFDAPVFGTVLPPNVRGTLGPGLPNPLAHPSSDVWIYSPKAALPAPAATAMDPLQPSSPGLIAFATLLCLAALGLSGMGWARAAGLDTTAAAATSPAFGFAALALIAIGLERLGLPLSGSIGPSVVALVAVSGSYVALQISKRQSVQEPPPQVDEG